MIAAHTPGPWACVADDDPRGVPWPGYVGLVAYVSESPRIAVVTDGRRAQPSEWAANARLLAAAPALLDACRLARDYLRDQPDPSTLAVWAALDGAIALAVRP